MTPIVLLALAFAAIIVVGTGAAWLHDTVEAALRPSPTRRPLRRAPGRHGPIHAARIHPARVHPAPNRRVPSRRRSLAAQRPRSAPVAPGWTPTAGVR